MGDSTISFYETLNLEGYIRSPRVQSLYETLVLSSLTKKALIPILIRVLVKLMKRKVTIRLN